MGPGSIGLVIIHQYLKFHVTSFDSFQITFEMKIYFNITQRELTEILRTRQTCMPHAVLKYT